MHFKIQASCGPHKAYHVVSSLWHLLGMPRYKFPIALTGIPGYNCPVALTRHTRMQVSCDTYQAYQDTNVLWHLPGIPGYKCLVALPGIPGYKCPVAVTRHTRNQVSCGTYQAYKDTSVLWYLPGIPWYKCPVQHFLGSEQIPDIPEGLHLAVSAGVEEGFIGILFLVSGSDLSQDLLGFCNLSFQQQISRRFWNVPWKWINTPSKRYHTDNAGCRY